MENDLSDRPLADVDSSPEKIRVWPIVSQSFAVLGSCPIGRRAPFSTLSSTACCSCWCR